MPEAISLSRAVDLFNLVASQSCDATNPSDTCNPFLYPDSGCEARAHEMCRLIIAEGIEPEKAWLHGYMPDIATVNHPKCKVSFGYHVAPVVHVIGFLPRMVIDPAFFPNIFPPEGWALLMGAKLENLAFSPAHVYYQGPGGTIPRDDPDYSMTYEKLRRCRNDLKLRVAAVGPPPYAQCRTDYSARLKP